jgi:transcriptional regulator with XRE-family HTH domain
MKDTTGFGERLRQLREAKGLSQMELAEAAGMWTNTVSRLENGRHTPPWSAVIALADALGCATDDFRPRERHRKAADATAELATPKKATRRKQQ